MQGKAREREYILLAGGRFVNAVNVSKNSNTLLWAVNTTGQNVRPYI